MKSILFAGVAVVALTGAAAAADLTYEPAPAPVVVSPVFDWTGFYAGVHAGGGWGNYDASWNGYTGLLDKSSGALGGAQVGYNYQINQFVIGAQADIAYTSLSDSMTVYTGLNPIGPGLLSAGVKAESNWLGTVTARAGYAADTWLFYAKGGFAYGQIEGTFNVSTPAATIQSSTSNWAGGWTVGGGVEKAFTKNLTGFLEYDYVSLGSVNFSTPLGGSANVDYSTNIVKAGVNYKF